MKQLTIVLLFFASILQGQTGAAYWHGSTEPGTITPETDTLTLTYWDDFILLHIANTGITEDANGVSQWQDRSGNGNHSTQTVNANKPSTDGSGNVVFDGVNDYLDYPTVLGVNPGDTAATFFVVFETEATITQGRAVVFWYEGNNATNDLSNTFYMLQDSVTSSSNADFFYAARDTVNPTSEWRLENIGLSAPSAINLGVVAASETTTSEFRLNGSEIGTLTSDGSWYGDAFGPSLGTGRGSELLVPFGGKIVFFGIANRKFTPAEIATTESELNSFFTIY